MSNSINVVTGGLGYIGQSIVAELVRRGQRAVIVDRRAIPSQVAGVEVIRADVRESAAWESFQDHPIGAVFHCAGLIQVGESVSEPARYFDDNIAAGIAMLEHLRGLGPVPVIFSSSAAVYGIPESTPIPETAPLNPLSPYGTTKRQFEEILAAYHHAYGYPFVALRYFNAAGSDGFVRENHEPETHLLPRVAHWIATGQAPVVYGRDYPTPDGTAIRDYVHIRDLVEAHLAARDYLQAGGDSSVINLGSGRGTSVLEMMEAFRRVVPDMPSPRFVERRPGDPPILVADVGRARRLLDWEPRHSDVDRIVSEVWGAVERP